VAAKLGIPRKQLEKAWLDRIATLALKEFTDEEEEPPKKSDFRELAAPEVIRRRKTGS
jgi:hypothetical protein